MVLSTARVVLSTVPLLLASTASHVLAQSISDEEAARAEKAFNAANELASQGKPKEALALYKKILATVPDHAEVLYNAGLAAYKCREFATAAELWKRLNAVTPLDWQAKAKLVQAYQALNMQRERDAARDELLDLWRTKRNAELNTRQDYCREQFEVDGIPVMVFEHFELRGNQAVRYVFNVLDKTSQAVEFRISLGSYDSVNEIWRQTAHPAPKPGERVFHLDGYFPAAHATYRMYSPEPSYDEVRSLVVSILQKKVDPISTTKMGPD